MEKKISLYYGKNLRPKYLPVCIPHPNPTLELIQDFLYTVFHLHN